MGHIAAHPFHFCIDGHSWFAVAVAVASHDPNPLSDVRCVDGCSRNNNRPPGVAVAFQVSEHLVEPQGDVTSNVLSNDPSGSDFANNSAHCRLEVARVIGAGSLACVAERLAWIASGDHVDRSDSVGSKPGSVKVSNVVIDRHLRPVLRQHAPAERVDLAERDGRHPGALEAE